MSQQTPDGRLGPICGFDYENGWNTGTFVYPVIINGSGNAIWRGDYFEVGLAVGQKNQLNIEKLRILNLKPGDTIQFGFEQEGQKHTVSDQQHKFAYDPEATNVAKFHYTGSGPLFPSMSYDCIQSASWLP